MGQIRPPKPAKLIVGLIFKDKFCLCRAQEILKKYFGEINLESALLPFTHTDYYKYEFGDGLTRKFISFQKLIPPERIAKIKIITNSIEKRLSRNKRRTINIDPGYIDLNKLVLVTTKDFTHRVYLGKGIYAEVTLYFRDSTFNPWPWTYPDYKTAEYIEFFNQVRKAYAQQLKIT